MSQQEDLDFYRNFVSQLERYPIYHALNNDKYERYILPPSTTSIPSTKIIIKKIGDSGAGKSIILPHSDKFSMTVSDLFNKIRQEFSIPSNNDLRVVFKGKALQPASLNSISNESEKRKAGDSIETIQDIVGQEEKEAIFYFMPIDKQIVKEEFWNQLKQAISDGVIDTSHADALYEGFKSNYRNYIKK